jgi:hypothetical protein
MGFIMNYLGKEVDQYRMEELKVDERINRMKDRSDYLDLSDRYNWRAYFKQADQVMNKLTWKQYQKVMDQDDPLSAVLKVSKSKKLHDKIYDLELYAHRIKYFKSIINPNFGFENDMNKLVKKV